MEIKPLYPGMTVYPELTEEGLKAKLEFYKCSEDNLYKKIYGGAAAGGTTYTTTNTVDESSPLTEEQVIFLKERLEEIDKAIEDEIKKTIGVDHYTLRYKVKECYSPLFDIRRMDVT